MTLKSTFEVTHAANLCTISVSLKSNPQTRASELILCFYIHQFYISSTREGYSVVRYGCLKSFKIIEINTIKTLRVRRSRSHETEVRFAGLAEASLSTPLVLVGFLVFFYIGLGDFSLSSSEKMLH